jgi:hypothetical protein
VLQEALQALDDDLIGQMQRASLADTEAHTRLVMGLQTNNAIRRQIWLMVQDGVSAVEEIRLRGRRID